MTRQGAAGPWQVQELPEASRTKPVVAGPAGEPVAQPQAVQFRDRPRGEPVRVVAVVVHRRHVATDRMQDLLLPVGQIGVREQRPRRATHGLVSADHRMVARVPADAGNLLYVALALFDEHPNIDVLVTDVVMPQMDGTELIKRVRALRPGMRIVCISGYAEETFRNRLDSAADIHFLPKPFTLEQLAGKVKQVIA